MDTLYYERGSFKSSEDAWSHIEVHWAECNPQVARRLDWEGVKSTYVAAAYWKDRWHLIHELIDYTERKPTPPGTTEIIGICPVCRKPALVQRGDFFVKCFYVHLMGVEDNGKKVPIGQHFIKHDRGGIIGASSI